MKFPEILYYPIHAFPYLVGLYAMLILASGNLFTAFLLIVVIVLPSLFLIERLVEKKVE
jgi:hypothetical protein